MRTWRFLFDRRGEVRYVLLMLMADKISQAHEATPTCNAASDSPVMCHSLSCRTKAFRLANPPPAPSPAVVVLTVRAQPLREALAGVFARAAQQPSYSRTVGTIRGGVEAILMEHLGMSAADAAALVDGTVAH